MRLLSSAMVLLLAVCATVNAAAYTVSSYTVGKVNPLSVDCQSYVIELLSVGEFDLGTAMSNVFVLNADASTVSSLVFDSAILGVGQIVSFSFDIMSPAASTSVDSIQYTAVPVPEPAIMSMLGLGAIGVIRKRKN